MARATGRTFLTATTDDAPALEGYRGHGVFTYALLDALDHADVNKNGLIEVSELADYIDQKVPDYSFEAFKLRQIPQRSIVGNNFALTNKTTVLGSTSSGAGGAPSQPKMSTPTRATHVVVAPVDIFDQPSAKRSLVSTLPAGTIVTAVKTIEGWVLLAKDGKELGFVVQSSLIPIQ